MNALAVPLRPSMPVEADQAGRAGQPSDGLIDRVVELGHDVVDVAGFMDSLDSAAHQQLAVLGQAGQRAGELGDASGSMVQTASNLAEVLHGLMQVLNDSTQRISGAVGSSRQVMGWVTGVGDQLNRIDQAMQATQQSNERIITIAREVNMLAINAKIEAARAGESGRGFSVVADAINKLSAQTGQAAATISETVRSLAAELDSLRNQAEEVAGRASTGLGELERADSALRSLATRKDESDQQMQVMVKESGRLRAVVQEFKPTFQTLEQAVTEQVQQIGKARHRISALTGISEQLVQKMFEFGGASADRPLIEATIKAANTLSQRLETAVASGQISEPDLFSTNYQPVPRSDPQQFMAPFTKLTDQLFPEVLEAALTLDPNIVFCAAVDRNGYLPTHNQKFSRPQGSDPVWNAANCRNRRIFDDRVGLGAGRSTAPFLMQIYRRDMGGGQFAMMKDVSAPIRVRGRHWGGLRLAYRF